jgi:serine/threonine-protein kinase
LQLGRYQILKQLATGSVADVLLARASGLEGFARHVVIKRIRPEMATEDRFVKAFLDEARIAGSLHHQNIVTVHDIGEQDGAYYFAMEYVHGEDARRLIGKVRERGESIPLEHALSIVMATAAGLHYAHEQSTPAGERLGLVHRDVSPQNILIGYDGSVKIVDFGMAKAVARSTTTMTSILKGKASYMSPEQCTGKPVDRRTDVFGLGIVLYELVTAQRLFKGANEFMTMAAIVEGVIPKPSSLRSEVPAGLDEIILRALQRSPESRYQTAESLRESLETFALSQELRTSGKALADYLTGLFGQRPEPWEARAATDPPPPEVDYEHTNAKGLVLTPGVSREEMIARLSLRAESPMMQAEAADGEWDDDDELVKTAGDLPSLGILNRGAARAQSESNLRTSPQQTVATEGRRPIDRRATSTGEADESQPPTLSEVPALPGKSTGDEVTRTEASQGTASDTATDLPREGDEATRTLRPVVGPIDAARPAQRRGDESDNRASTGAPRPAQRGGDETENRMPIIDAARASRGSGDETENRAPVVPSRPSQRGGDETDNLTLVEPSTFDSASDRTSAGGDEDDDAFASEVATEIAQDDDPPWKHHDDARAGAGKGRVSPAVIPRSSLPASQRSASLPAAHAASSTPGSQRPSPGSAGSSSPPGSQRPTPMPGSSTSGSQRPTPMPGSSASGSQRPSPMPGAASTSGPQRPSPMPPPTSSRAGRPSAPPPPRPLGAPASDLGGASSAPGAPLAAAGPLPPLNGPGGPLTLQGHSAPGGPSTLGAPAGFPPLQATYPAAPAPAPVPLPPVPFVQPQSPFGAEPAAPSPPFDLRGGLRVLVEKHATRLWLAGGVALVLLVILAARGCGDAPAHTNAPPAADTPAEK